MRCTSLVIKFLHERRKLEQESNTFGRMGLTGQMNRQTPMSIALLRQFRGLFHQQSYHGQRRGDIAILGRLLRGWWMDSRPCVFVVVVVIIFIGPSATRYCDSHATAGRGRHLRLERGDSSERDKLFLVIMSELDMTRSSLLSSKVDILSNFEKEPSEADNISSNKVSSCRVSAPAPLIIGPLDPSVSSFCRIHQHETINQSQIERLDETLPFWNIPLSVLALAATTTNPWTTILYRVQCHDATTKHQILVASLHKSDRSFQPLTTKKYLLSCNVFFLLSCKHLLSPRIRIECRKQVNHSRTKSLCFIRPFLILARILPCSFTS